MVGNLRRPGDENSFRDMREYIQNAQDDALREVRGSDHGLLKILGLELISPIIGMGVAGIGRSSGMDWISVVPIGINVLTGASYVTLRGFAETVKYGLGVAIVYLDKIYPLIEEMF